MVDNNKILTVSYGTFSCTLEGFDDPFNAMKSIAEYFRDLAEKDRSFGAEPVAPDASVLHRIAERETLKQVDAQIEDKSIVLRQSAEDLKPRETVPVDAAPAKADVTQLRTAAFDAQDEGHGGATHDLDESDALSKLSLLRAAAEEEVPVSDEFLEDEHAAKSTSEDLNEFEELISSHIVSTDAEDEPVSETAGRDAKRQRVKDRIAMNDDGTSDATDGDDAAPFGTALTAGALAATALDGGDAGGDVDDGAADEPAKVSRVLRVKRQRRDDGKDSIVISQTNTPESDGIEDATEVETASDALTADAEADLAAELARAESDTRAELKATTAPLPPLSLDDTLRVAVQEIATKADEDLPVAQDEDAPKSELHHEIEALLSTMEAESRMDARRERRAQVFDDQEVAQDDTALERILAETNTQMDDQDASRRRNSISHLKAAVQATRADQTSGDDKSETKEEQQETVYRSDLAQAVKPPSADATKSPEPQRASPLVLVSEQRVKEADADQDTSATAARDRVIRPRRVNVSTSRKRSDAAGTDPDAEPVVNDNPELDAFTAFTADIDRADIPGYMRAAAAFVTQESGEVHFNRPTVVKLVTQLDVPGGITREDALRAFGRLLREGDIIKVAQGCYSLTTVAQEGKQTA